MKNIYSAHFHKAIEELDEWLLMNYEYRQSHGRFFNRVKELLEYGMLQDSEESAASAAKSVTHMLVDSGPQVTLTEEFLPSHTLICRAVEKAEKKRK